MKPSGHRAETTTAIIERLSERFIELRYHVVGRFDAAMFERDRKVRWKLSGRMPHALLIILPAELPVYAPAMNDDHFRRDSEARMVIALAVVAPTTAQNMAAKFYFRYHAQAFEARVFEQEDEARSWLMEELERARP